MGVLSSSSCNKILDIKYSSHLSIICNTVLEFSLLIPVEQKGKDIRQSLQRGKEITNL